MNSANLGILLLDTGERKVVFQNLEARELLGDALDLSDYGAVFERLVGSLPGLAPEAPLAPPPLRLEHRLLGYTVYRGGRFVWLFLRDISEKARLEAIAEAVELTNSIGYIFSTVRHEIGNPVNSVKTALTVLRNNVASFSRESIRGYVERSLAELGRLEELLASLKSFSMYEDVRVQDLELEPCVRRTIDLVGPEFAKKGIAISLDLSPAARVARFDARALHQVMLNLLTNAADSLEGRPDPHIRIRSFARPGLVGLAIRDNGCGISEEQRAHLFQPFASTKASGTGLGLVIAKKMLARMDATIDVVGEPGVGTVVSLVLPAPR